MPFELLSNPHNRVSKYAHTWLNKAPSTSTIQITLKMDCIIEYATLER